MAFLNKDIQAAGTIAAAKKAHDNAEKEYKALVKEASTPATILSFTIHSTQRQRTSEEPQTL